MRILVFLLIIVSGLLSARAQSEPTATSATDTTSVNELMEVVVVANPVTKVRNSAFNATAINDAVLQRNNSPAANLTKVSAAARRAKAAERKAQSEGTAERSESPRCGSVARRQPSGAEAPDARLESCGEAEVELPVTYFTPAMVKYLRRHPSSI